MEKQNEMVLQIISQLNKEAGNPPCKKKVQKIIYLMEAKGIELGFDYKLYIYGPYCADLDYIICELMTDNILDVEYTNSGHILKSNFNEWQEELPLDIINIIKVFGKKRASELEVITTALFAYNNITDKSDKSVIEAVKKIKGKKFAEQRIEKALQLLKSQNFIIA